MQRIFLFSLVLWAIASFAADVRSVAAQEEGGRSDPFVILQASELTESSGVAQIGQLLWTHNDSGDRPRLFAFATDGRLRAEFDIAGAQALDWEDLCAFTRDGKQYLAVGDVGDNLSLRSSVNIYVIEVPAHGSLTGAASTSTGSSTEASTSKASTSKASTSKASTSKASTSKAEKPLTVATTFEVTYSTGPVNCEALAYDPLTQSFLLATKELTQCRLFRVPVERLAGKQQVQAELIGALRLPLVTGGDISPDGKQLVLATYGPGCLLERNSNGAVEGSAASMNWRTDGDDAALIFELPNRRQGESICFSPDGLQMWLTSEHIPAPLFHIAVPSRR